MPIPYRIRAVAIGIAAAVVLAGCQIQPATPPAPNLGQDPSPVERTHNPQMQYNVGEPVQLWTESDGSGEGIQEVMDAHPTPVLFTDIAAWQVWVDGLPESLHESAAEIDPDFAREAILVGSYYDCMSVPAVDHHGEGELEFVVSAYEDVDCEWSPRTIVLMSIQFEEIGVEPGGVALV